MGEDGDQSADWKTVYRDVMQQLGLNPDTADGLRKSTRISFIPPEQTILVRIGSLVGALTDISVGGVALHAGSLLTKDRKVKLNFDDKFRTEVRIVSSVLLGSDPEGIHAVYRTGAQFTMEDDGYRCTVLALRLYSRASKM